MIYLRTMNRQWINHNGVRDRLKPEYLKGVNQFLDFAFEKLGGRRKIRCPCMKCINHYFQDRSTVFDHLVYHGILKTYTRWDLHGEGFDCGRESEKSVEDENAMDSDETISLVNDAMDGVACSKSTRGRTVGKKWAEKRNKMSGPIPIEINSSLLKVVGENSQQFITEIGTLVRQFCPLNVHTWKGITNDVKQFLLKKLKEMFIFPEEPYVDHVLIDYLRRRYKDWRYQLHKKYYLKYKTDRERLNNCPGEIDEEQWKWLVKNHWGTKNFQKKREANIANRDKQRMLPVVGTKSLARTLHELGTESSSRIESSQQTDKRPVYLRFFERAYRKKNGQWTDDIAKETYDQLVRLHENEIAVHGTDSLSTQEAFHRVLGQRSMYQRGTGSAPKTLVPQQTGYLHGRMTEQEINDTIQKEVARRVEEQLQQKVQGLREQMRNDMLSFLREQIGVFQDSSSASSGSSSIHPIATHPGRGARDGDNIDYACKVCNISKSMDRKACMNHMRSDEHLERMMMDSRGKNATKPQKKKKRNMS